jgi:hypothetical protein
LLSVSEAVLSSVKPNNEGILKEIFNVNRNNQGFNYHLKIRFACAALFFLIGANTKKSAYIRKFDLPKIKESFLAGNGTRVFEALIFDSSYAFNKVNRFKSYDEYLTVFYHEGGNDGRAMTSNSIKINPSAKRKHEVASGLMEPAIEKYNLGCTDPTDYDSRVLPDIRKIEKSDDINTYKMQAEKLFRRCGLEIKFEDDDNTIDKMEEKMLNEINQTLNGTRNKYSLIDAPVRDVMERMRINEVYRFLKVLQAYSTPTQKEIDNMNTTDEQAAMEGKIGDYYELFKGTPIEKLNPQIDAPDKHDDIWNYISDLLGTSVSCSEYESAVIDFALAFIRTR